MKRVLLDTSFLLPIVGVRVRGVEEIIKELWHRYRRGEVEVYYSDLSLLEILWKLSRIDYDPLIVEKGFKSIERHFQKAPLTVGSLIKALELRRRGFKDLIDLLLYTIALENKLNLLTLDKSLVEFIKEIGGDTSIIINKV